MLRKMRSPARMGLALRRNKAQIQRQINAHDEEGQA